MRSVGCERTSGKGIGASLGVAAALRLLAVVIGVIASAYAWSLILPDQSASGSIARDASIVAEPKASRLRDTETVIYERGFRFDRTSRRENASIHDCVTYNER